MTRKIAVITDALSDSHCFPIWYRYYGQAVAAQNLFVATYPGLEETFRRYPLGGIWVIPRQYEEQVRALAMASLVDRLLEHYEIVVRVDVDEIAVPDPRRHASLAAYLQQLDRPFVTARGIDIIQHPDEPPLDWRQPVIGRQRAYGYALTALNKTCVTTMSLKWSPGFHGCSVHPMFHDLLLLHLKRIDIDSMVSWHAVMNRSTPGDDVLLRYYHPARDHIVGFLRDVSARPVVDGWDGIGRLAFNARFYATMRYDRASSIYEMEYLHDDVLIRLPAALHGVV